MTFVRYEEENTTSAVAVKNQIEEDCLDQGLVGLLEAYLDEQLVTNVVDIEANLKLLQLYTVYPALLKEKKVAEILVKALMALPSSYFKGTTFMISESLRTNDETIQELLKAGDLLQACLFKEFWQLEMTFANAVKGFDAAVRQFIISAIEKSHASVSDKFVKEQLNLSDNELSKIISEQEWTLEQHTITVKPNAENQIRPKKFKEDISFADLQDVIKVLSR